MTNENVKYTIERPPLSPDFQLPTREELLNLKVGDLVKIMFRHPVSGVERMWVIIKKQQDIAEWTGVLDNNPLEEEMSKVLKSGDKVVFHPLDVIQIYDKNNNKKNISQYKGHLHS
jgi:hypothetical protein